MGGTDYTALEEKENQMKIGTCVTLSSIGEMPGKLSLLRKNGFDSCQLLSWDPVLWTAENATNLKNMLQDHAVTVSAFWCGWEGPKVWNFYEGPLTLGLVPPEYRQMRIRNLTDGADFAHLLGITDVATHMGFIPENPNDPEFEGFCAAVRTVAQHLEKNGQYLLFETGQETPVTMLRCFEQTGCSNLAVNLDTANVILYGKANPVDALDVFGKYVRGLHAKDGCYPTNGHDLGQETRIGQGKVDFRALFTRLKQLGYNAPVTIEREIDGDQQLKDILYAREYLEQILREID